MGDISTGASKVLTMKTVNPRAVEMEFAVSGSIATRAVILRKELEAGEKKPFTKVLQANIGDCHATGQNPLTFIRQVVATCAYPELIDTANFPDDVKTKARRLLQGCKGQSVGSYSASHGIDVIRKDVANYISKRDGLETSADDVILCSGVSDGIRIILNLLMTGKDGDGRAGIMIPVPQYPLYSATITEFNACPIPYYLNEEEDWSLDVSELNRAINEIRGKCMPIALCVINPGNPTGQVLSRENIEGIIRFAQKEKVMILADEIYQHNIWAKGSKFFSFRKVMTEMDNGYIGECGFRGGYAEVANLRSDVKAKLLKSISAKLCPPILGQVVIDIVVNPPLPGEPSYDLFEKEKFENKNNIKQGMPRTKNAASPKRAPQHPEVHTTNTQVEVLSQLKKKAQLITELFSSIEGIKCSEVKGAMYAFPRIFLPPKAVAAAKDHNQTPDVFYCMKLLENTGLCTMPGSVFGEKPGT